MKLRQFFAVIVLTMGITTLQFAVLGASTMMVVCGLLQIGAAFRIV